MYLASSAPHCTIYHWATSSSRAAAFKNSWRDGGGEEVSRVGDGRALKEEKGITYIYRLSA